MAKTHGFSDKERLYTIWNGIKLRCYNPNDPNYLKYGIRGITMCDEWRTDYLSFRKWAIKNGYTENLSIDRINNYRNYEPSNCKWSTSKEQCSNRRSNVIVNYNGESMTLKQLCEKMGKDYRLVHNRYRRYGWNLEDSLTTPVDISKSHKKVS